MVDSKQSESVRGPLLAFSYAGMLWSYYLGVVGMIPDSFIGDLCLMNVLDAS